MQTVLLRAFEKLVHFLADGTRANAVPDENQNDGDEEDQGGNGVDLRSDAAAKARPDFERESIVAADEEKGDGDLVHGQGEDEETSSDKRKFQIRKSDAPEGLPGGGAEIEGGFFLRAVHFLQAGEKFGGGDGEERGAMSEEDADEAELKAGKDREHQ